jgi:hypothetical protein
MNNNGNYSYAYIASATTTQVATGAGRTLVAITVNTTSVGAISIIDGVSGTTPNIGTLKASIPEGTYWYNVAIRAGIRIVTAGASDITVIYK